MPWAWDHRFATIITQLSFQNCKSDTYLFVLHKGTNMVILLLYMDDIVLTTSSSSLLQHIIQSLSNELDMTDLGTLDYFLDISVTSNQGGLFLFQ